jgi:hypothetical protein
VSRFSDFIHTFLGINTKAPDLPALNHAHTLWREAMHDRRNEVTKAVAIAVQSRKLTEKVKERIEQTIEKQEDTKRSVDRAFIDRARGLK